MRYCAFTLALIYTLVASFTLNAANVEIRKESPCHVIAFPENILFVDAWKPIFHDIYSEIGRCVEIVDIQYERASYLLKEGKIDGNFARGRLYLNSNPDIPYVEEPFASVPVIYVGRKDFTSKVKTVSDLRGQNIGHMRDMYWPRALAKTYGLQIHSIRSYDQFMEMFYRGRVDGFLIDELSYKRMLKSNMINDTEFHISIPLHHIYLFHALAPQHKDLVAELTPFFGEYLNEDKTQYVFNNWLDKNEDFFFRYTVAGSRGRFPFTLGLKDSPDVTVFSKILPKILSKAGITAYEYEIDIENQIQALEGRVIDVLLHSPSFTSREKVADFGMYSAPLYEMRDLVMSHPSADRLPDIEALYNVRVGVVKGYKYHDEDKLNILRYPTEDALFNALINRKVDHIIIGELVYKYLADKYESPMRKSLVHSSGAFHFLIHKKYKDLMPKINLAIKEAGLNGELDEVMKQFTYGD